VYVGSSIRRSAHCDAFLHIRRHRHAGADCIQTINYNCFLSMYRQTGWRVKTGSVIFHPNQIIYDASFMAALRQRLAGTTARLDVATQQNTTSP